MFVDFFIRRPIFASVCAIVIVLIGAISIPMLPVAQYPELAPPQVQVVSNYIGASAQVVESAVTTPLEQQINGAEGMRYMTSTSANDGSSTITVTFDVGRNKDLAAVDVQNRVSTAVPRLPAEVRNVGVNVFKTTPAMVIAAGFYSEDGSLSNIFLSNYLDLYVRDAIKRIPGTSEVRIFGERRYAMRLWLDPVPMAARDLTASDVVAALREQNALIAPGQIGKPPAPPGQTFQISVRAVGRFSEPAEFERMILKHGADGSLVTLKDIGRAELGAEDYSLALRFDGHDAVGIGVFQLPGANALQLESAIRAELERLAASFPPSMRYKIAFNPTAAVRSSIDEVLKTLAEAIVLVILVIFVFLQDWRATIIPAVTIPVSLIGTFAFVKAFDFSINTLTLFGIVLATGLVVDDAIVVVENIARNLAEHGGRSSAGAAGRDDASHATRQAMREVTGAVMATSLVLIAVFVPVAFLPGTTGRLYVQFALTIAFSVAISAFNALTLAPALSAILMRAPRGTGFPPFQWFNRNFTRLHDHYRGWLSSGLHHLAAALGTFVVGIALTLLVFRSVPTAFVPDEDQNYFIVQVLGPQGASLDYMRGITLQMEKVLRGRPEVQDMFAVSGFNFTGNGPNRGVVFVNLRPVSERRGDEHSAAAVVQALQRRFAAIPGAVSIPFLPPPIQGTGATSGFSFQLLDRGNNPDITPLAQAGEQLAAAAARDGRVRGLFSTFSIDDPQLLITIDREKAKSLNVPFNQITDTLGVFLGSQYVNDFDFNNRSYRVYAQADAAFRNQPSNIGQFYVAAHPPGAGPVLTPLANLVAIKQATAPPVISHYNLFRSIELNGAPAAGVSSGQAIAAMEQVASRVLPADLGYEWSGLSWEEVRTGRQSLIIFVLGVTFAFLVMSAQYESFALPFVIILAVPLALLGALVAQKLRGQSNDVFCQIGLLMLVGLASKNAILVVEFAEQLRQRGASAFDAVVEAAVLRLRPILMTSFAFLLGVLPLVFASGAGAAGRRSLGTAVFGGLLLATVLNLFFTPVLYLIFERARERFVPRLRSRGRTARPMG